jgi:hypothetical protein
MQYLKAIITFAIASAVLAQEVPAPPVQAKRLPPDKAKPVTSKANDALLDRYDFGAQVNTLQGASMGLRPIQMDENRFQ